MPSVPYTFSPHTIAESAKVNANFALFTQVLGLTGGTLTGQLVSRSIVPSADDTYSLGSTGTAYIQGVFSQNISIKDFGEMYFLNIFANSTPAMTASRDLTLTVLDADSQLIIDGTVRIRATQVEPYSAGDFTAAGGGTWTVEEGDVFSYQWTEYDDAITMNVNIVGSTIAGTVSGLRVALPNGYTSFSYVKVWARVDIAGVAVGAEVTVDATNGYAAVVIPGGGNFSTGTNNVNVSFQLWFVKQ